MSSSQRAMLRKVLSPKPQIFSADGIDGVRGVANNERLDSDEDTDTSSTVGSEDDFEEDSEDSDEDDSDLESEDAESEEEDMEMLEQMAAEVMRFTSDRTCAPASSSPNFSLPQRAQFERSSSMRRMQPSSSSGSLTVVRQDDSGLPDSTPLPLLRGKTNVTLAPTEKKSMRSEEYDDCSPTRRLLKMVGELGGPEDLFVPTKNVEDYFIQHSPEQIAAYTADFVRMLRSNNLEEIRRMHQENGHILQASNAFGETVIHIACRRGAFAIIKYFVEEGGVSIRVRDDYGRTPLHDCCWTAEPNVELMTYLVHLEPDMLFMTDAKGFTPLEYARMNHRSTWNKFLEDIRTVVACKCQAKRLKCSI